MSDIHIDLSSDEVRQIWQQSCKELEIQVSTATFNTWILTNSLSKIELVGSNKAICTILSPTAFHSTNLKNKLGHKLIAVFNSVLGRDSELEFEIGVPIRAPQPSPTPNTAFQGQTSFSAPDNQTQSNHTHHSQNIDSQTKTASDNPQNAFSQNNTPGQNTKVQGGPNHTQTHSFSPRVEDLFSPQNIASNTVNRVEIKAKQIGLRRDYTFETFAVSTTNELAHAAATAVSQRPGEAYNPLFMYGGVGVGKTHLMHAIANNILDNNPESSILYCTGEEFTNEIVEAIQTKKALKFKAKYRNTDVLLIDDIQFIAGKNTVQEEFFHTFNALTQQNHQIILTSDRPPHEINLLEDRLRSRFEAGLMVDIQVPTFELGTAILLIKNQAAGLDMPMEIAQTIASQVDSARKIEGLLKKIRSEVELKNKELDDKLISQLLRNGAEQPTDKLRVSPQDVLRAVANHYRIKQVELKGTSRVQNLAKARHLAMYLLREEVNLSLIEIGRWFSGRDHSSVIHAIKRIQENLETDPSLQRDFSSIRMSLSAVSR